MGYVLKRRPTQRFEPSGETFKSDDRTGSRRVWLGDGSSLTVRVLERELVRRGFDPHPLLKGLGLSHQEVRNPLVRVPRNTIFRFGEKAAELTGDPAFHLHATAHADIGAFGVLDFVVTMAPTLGVGMERVAAGYSLINSGLRIEAVVTRKEAYYRLTPTLEPSVHPLDVETLAVAVASRLEVATHGAHGVLRIERKAPETVYRPVFEQIVRCPVHYGAPEDRILFTRATWDARCATSHPGLRSLISLAAPLVDALVPRPGLVASVESVLEERLEDGGLSAGQAAGLLGMSERTLHRRLGREGEKFGEILDRLRLRVARAALASGESVASVALRLGFSEPGAFTRAYRRWTGVPPSAHRDVTPGESELS